MIVKLIGYINGEDYSTRGEQYINTEHILFFSRFNSGSMIFLSGGYQIIVEEAPDKISDFLK